MTFRTSRLVAALGCSLLGSLHATDVSFAQSVSTAPARPGSTSTSPKDGPAHRVVIQVTQNDPALMNLALNNAENLSTYYASRGESVQIEFVAFGPGLAMLRSDTSPVKDRLSALAASKTKMTFTGCGNTMAAQGKAEGKEITLVPQAAVVPAGIARLLDLQEQGWHYVRP